MTATPQAVRRKAVVDAWADQALREADAVEARAAEQAKAEVEAEAERAALTVERDRLAAARLQAIGVAERLAGELIDQFAGILDAAARLAGEGGCIDTRLLEQAVQHRFAAYDKGGEEHFNIISALHKSVRGSDPDAALYWLARMLEAGEDPLYVARRLVRIASEDVGLADPEALAVTLAARDAYHFLGSPEGELALAQAVLYLATAPKSNRAYMAWKAARDLARETPAAAVPLHIRNAPTGLMKELGYGKGYAYDPDQPDGVSAQAYLPEDLQGRRFYEPGPYGHEKAIRKRLEWWESRRASPVEPQDPPQG